MTQIQYFLLVSKPIGRTIKFMRIESIVRKTSELKRYCVTQVREEKANLVLYLIPDKRYKLIRSCCGG